MSVWSWWYGWKLGLADAQAGRPQNPPAVGEARSGYLAGYAAYRLDAQPLLGRNDWHTTCKSR